MQGHTEIKSGTLVDQSYWDDSYESVKPQIVPADDQLRLWLEKHLPAGKNSTCMEIGCYPARYLSVLGELGYTLNGIDLTPGVTSLGDYLKSKYTTGEFIHANFLTYPFDGQYDVVCSFGFIEHFSNWEEVLLKHASLVKPNGLLVIETPNFAGWFQRQIHSIFDSENLKRHNLKSMNPELWSELLSANNFEIIRSEYFGKFEFWSDTKERNALHKLGIRILGYMTPILRKVTPGRRSISPYCGLIARRKS